MTSELMAIARAERAIAISSEVIAVGRCSQTPNLGRRPPGLKGASGDGERPGEWCK
ncbi:hypothetical protein MAHJHV57_51350 [Mycobacterium avium subsp. hominissuis]